MTFEHEEGQAAEWQLRHDRGHIATCVDEWLCSGWTVFHKTAAEDDILGGVMHKAQAQDLQSKLNQYASAARDAQKLRNAVALTTARYHRHNHLAPDDWTKCHYAPCEFNAALLTSPVSTDDA